MGKKLTEGELIENVKRECLVRNYEFIGIVGEFKGSRTKLKLRCIEHDFIWESTTYNNFMRKRGCSICAHVLKLTKEKLIENVKRECLTRDYEFLGIVGEFNGSKTKLKLRCIKHDFIWESTTYNKFFSNRGCPKCGLETQILCHTLTELELTNNVKKECLVYNYEFIGIVGEFNGSKTKLKLRCIEHDFIWESTTYNSFFNGSGCLKCNFSKLELKIEKILKENNVKFIPQYRFKELMKKTSPQSLDFYLEDYNIAIECQGEQHFKIVKHFGGNSNFKLTLERDKRKYNICKEQGIRILYYTECSTDIIPTNYHDKIFTNELELLREILENNNKID